MKPLFYLLKKSIKNTLNEILKKPRLLISYTFMILFFALMIGYSIFMPASSLKKVSNDSFGAIVVGIILFIVYTGVSQGITKGSSFFRQADVNLVFPAPISPKRVLIYGFIKQLKSTILIIFIAACQLPNAKNFLSLKSYGGLLLLIVCIFMMFSMSIIGIFTYSAASKSNSIKKYIKNGLNAVYGFFGLILIFSMIKSKNPVDAATGFFNGALFTYFPFIGWFKGVCMGAVTGLTPAFFINLFLVLASLILMIYILYTMNTDYYEDVLAATEYTEQLLQNKKAGKSISLNSTGKLRKVKQTYKGTGAKAIFNRHLLEYKKSGFFFINKGTIITAAAGIIYSLFIPGKNLNVILYFSIYMLFLFQMQGKWIQELSNPYICLIPSSSASKVFYSTLADNIKNIIDGFVLFIAAGIIFKADPVSIILCALGYASFGSVFLYSDVLSRRIFGTHSKGLEFFLKFLLIILIITPGIVISVIVLYTLHNGLSANYISYVVLILYNLIISLLFLILGKGIFEKLEII